MRFPVPLLVVLAALGVACARTAPPPPPAADEPFAGPTIVVDDPAWTQDAAGDCDKATFGDLPGPDGKTTLPDALCVAEGPAAARARVRIRIDLDEDHPIRVPGIPFSLPESVAVVDAPAGRMALLVAGDPGYINGLVLPAERAAPLTLRRLVFRGFGNTAFHAEARAPVAVVGCRFEGNHRAMFHQTPSLLLRDTAFVGNRVVAFKTKGANVTVEGCLFARGGSANRNHGLYGFFAEAADRVVVRRCRFVANGGTPEIAWAVRIDRSRRVRVEDCDFAANSAEEIALEDSTDVEIVGNRIVSGPRADSAQAAVHVLPGGRGIAIRRNAIEAGTRAGITVVCAGVDAIEENAVHGDAETGIRWYGCDAIADLPSASFSVAGNRVSGFPKEGIHIQGPVPRTLLSGVSNNRLAGNGVGLVYSGETEAAEARGNEITGSRGSGIRVDDEADGVTISTNFVSGSGANGIEILSRGNVVTGNRATGNGGQAIYFAYPEAQKQVQDNRTDDAAPK